MGRSATQIVNDNGRILFAKFFQQRIPEESFLVQIPTIELWSVETRTFIAIISFVPGQNGFSGKVKQIFYEDIFQLSQASYL